MADEYLSKGADSVAYSLFPTNYASFAYLSPYPCQGLLFSSIEVVSCKMEMTTNSHPNAWHFPVNAPITQDRLADYLMNWYAAIGSEDFDSSLERGWDWWDYSFRRSSETVQEPSSVCQADCQLFWRTWIHADFSVVSHSPTCVLSIARHWLCPMISSSWASQSTTASGCHKHSCGCHGPPGGS